MNTNAQNLPAAIPAELRNQLPIFQVLGDRLPPAVKQPEGKKTISAALFWIIVIGGAVAFVKYLPQLLEFAQKAVLLTVFSIILIVLLLLAPKIISFLHRLGSTILFKGEKSIIRNNPIESLQMLLQDAKDTLKRVKAKIASVDGVRLDMIQSGVRAQDAAQEKYTLAKRFTQQAANIEAQTGAASGDAQKLASLNREAKETRTKAFLLGKEGEAEEQNARSYAQYANQFAKVLEVLRDNESAARIYVSTLDSSISIIAKKMEATNKMKSATDGLAEVFNIKDGWVFQEAMGAATAAISHNIASIRSNLEFLDQNNTVTVGGTPSQEELNAFMQKVDQRNMQMLNVGDIASPAHDLSPEERVDKGFTLLD